MLDVGKYVRLGTTPRRRDRRSLRQDREAFGPRLSGRARIEGEAKHGDAERFILPRPMLGRAEPDFSLSGLKTALRIEAEKVAPLSDQDVADLCAAFSRPWWMW